MDQDRFAGHYLSSHPLHDQRVASLKEQAAEQGFKADGELAPVIPFKSAAVQPVADREQTEDSISENN